MLFHQKIFFPTARRKSKQSVLHHGRTCSYSIFRPKLHFTFIFRYANARVEAAVERGPQELPYRLVELDGFSSHNALPVIFLDSTDCAVQGRLVQLQTRMAHSWTFHIAVDVKHRNRLPCSFGIPGRLSITILAPPLWISTPPIWSVIQANHLHGYTNIKQFLVQEGLYSLINRKS